MFFRFIRSSIALSAASYAWKNRDKIRKFFS